MRIPAYRRRHRTLAGSELASQAADIAAFTPSGVDTDQYVERLRQLVDGLAHSVDEATGHVLDNLINSWTDLWIAALDSEHEKFHVTSRLAEGSADARESLTRLLWMSDLVRLVEVGLAVESTLAALVDDLPDQGLDPDNAAASDGERVEDSSSDDARSDDARSDDARSDDARSDDARSDDARSDDARTRDDQ